MMTKPTVHTLLSGATGTGAGGVFELGYRPKTFNVEGITTATVDIQARNNSSESWVTVQSFTSDAMKTNFDVLPQIRANVSAYTSGTITVTVSEQA